jgi:hypothetical protein
MQLKDISLLRQKAYLGDVTESGISREGSHYGIDEYLCRSSVRFGGMRP